ncbi:MAG: nicotinamide mononucleotide transporter [Saprospiraceae bacterium]|nr:nicotinamide mononucleotide transporter [Saprospiraceae bacterium]
MERIIDFLVEPYRLSATYLIVLEILAASTGILSVYFSRIENILVYPSGLISTGLYVYILNVYELRGDMLINAYFFAMSIYGWINWSRALKGTTSMVSITRTTLKEKMYGILIFAGGILFVYYAYKFFNTKITYITYIDSLNTALFFVAMWYMALKKLENWTLWIAGNIVSVPLYLIKGLGFTAIQYSVFLVLAVMGYIEWRKRMTQANAGLNKIK